MAVVAWGENESNSLGGRIAGHLGRVNRGRGSVICDQTMRRMTDGFGRRAAVPLMRVGEILTVDRFADEAEVGEDEAGARQAPANREPTSAERQRVA